MAENDDNGRGQYRRYRKSNQEESRLRDDATAKLPPQATDIEATVLGALMLEKDAYSEVSDLLVPESFYDPKHRKIYEAIFQLGTNQRPIDMLTVTEQLRANGTLEEVGGAIAVSELTSNVLSAANVEYHARIIAQKYLARRLITFASKVQTDAFDEANDIAELLEQAEGKLFEISQQQLKREVVQVDSVIAQAMRQIEIASQQKGGISGLATGYRELDKMTSGWQPSDLIIIAARPAMGKTAFVLSMAKQMAMDLNIPVGVFSLEMSNVQLVNRILSNVCEVKGETIRSGQLSDSEWDRLNSRVKNFYGAPLYLDETPGLSIMELRTKARRLVREHGVKVIIIDYLQLMNATGMKFGSREQEVSMISRSLKALAKELNIPVIALSQLNRSTESRDDKRPVLSDLRESGAIEQDADFVAFIHRPEYYSRSGEDKAGNDIRGLAEFIIAKHRNGQVGTVQLRFTSEFVRFENWDDARATVQEITVRSRMNRDKGAEPFGAPQESAPADSPFTGFPDGGVSPFGPGADGTNPDIMPSPGSSPLPF